MADRSLDVRLRVLGARAFNSEMSKGQSGVRRLGSSAKGASKHVGLFNRTTAGGIGTMKRAASAAIGLGAAYIGISQAKAAITTQNDLARATLGMSNTLGLSTRTSSEWLSVAKARGIESRALAQSFGILSKNVDAANQGGATQIDTFKRLGLTQDDLKRGQTDMQFLLGRVSDGFANLPKGTKRAALGMKLLGRGWQTVFPLLRDGSKNMEEQIGLAGEYGAVMDKKAVKQSMKLVSAQRELKLAGVGLQLQFAKAVTPALTDLAGRLTDVGKIMNDPKLTSEEKFDKISDMVADLFDDIGDKMEDAKFGEHLAGAFEAALPKVAEAAGRGGALFARSFARGWWNADIGGKLFVAALLFNKIGIFGFLGKRASEKFIATFAPRLAAALGIEMAASGTVGGAVAGSAAAKARWGRLGGIAGKAFKVGLIAAATIGLYEGLKGPFNQALEDLGLALNADDPTDGEAQRKADERAGNLPKSKPLPLLTPEERRRRRREGGGGLNSIGGASLKGMIRVENRVYLDGKQVAESVGRHTADRKARK